MTSSSQLQKRKKKHHDSKRHRLPRLGRITLLHPHRFRNFIASLPQPRFECPSGGFVRVGRHIHATHIVLHTIHTSRRVLPTVHRLRHIHASHRRVLPTSSRVNPTQTNRGRITNNDIRNVPPEPRDWISRFQLDFRVLDYAQSKPKSMLMSSSSR